MRTIIFFILNNVSLTFSSLFCVLYMHKLSIKHLDTKIKYIIASKIKSFSKHSKQRIQFLKKYACFDYDFVAKDKTSHNIKF